MELPRTPTVRSTMLPLGHKVQGQELSPIQVPKYLQTAVLHLLVCPCDTVFMCTPGHILQPRLFYDADHRKCAPRTLCRPH